MFYSDKPISSSHEDLLGRSGFAKILAQTLLNLNTTDTFSVGLYGKWGCGKTSLVNMTLNEIGTQQTNVAADQKCIVVHFEPWNFSNANQLLSQFFIRLANEFRSTNDKTLAKIGKALETYSDAFYLAKSIPLVGEGIARIGKTFLSQSGRWLKKGFDDNDILKQKESIIDLIRKQNRKILVVIDDIDRLSNEQIRQVFQLITSVAKFPNTIYLLVFDKEIVAKALETIQEGSGNDYLEKIIQMPIQIPDIEKEKLRNVFFTQLDNLLKSHEGISFQENYWQKIYMPCIDPFIDTIRSINRLSNSVQFKMTTLFSEINFVDIIAISAIEASIPNIYEWIKRNKPLLTEGSTFSDYGREVSQKEQHDRFYTEIQSLLDSNKPFNTETILTALSWLFPKFGLLIGNGYESCDYNSLRQHNRIAHPNKFNRYFDLDLDNITLKTAEITQAIYALNSNDLKTLFLNCDKNGMVFELLEEIKASLPKLSSNRAKNILDTLFNVSTTLDSYDNNSMFSRPANRYAEHLIIDLLDVVIPGERLNYLSSSIHVATQQSFQTLAIVINLIELAYGRLAANGNEHDIKKVITLDELVQLEQVFTEKGKEFFSSSGLFSFAEWRMICHLMESFEPEYTKRYLTFALRADRNIVCYLKDSVSLWSGSTTEYEINRSYEKHLTKERILLAIDALRASGELFSLAISTQNQCAAFFLYAASNSEEHQFFISQAKIDKLLLSWH